MKKKHINNKRSRIISAGLLGTTAVFSVSDVPIALAQEDEKQDTVVASSDEEVEVSLNSKNRTYSSSDVLDSVDSIEESTEESTGSSSNEDGVLTGSESSEEDTTTPSTTAPDTTTPSTTAPSTTTPDVAGPVNDASYDNSHTSTSNNWNSTYHEENFQQDYEYGNTPIALFNDSYYVSPNLTTQRFIDTIGEDAREIAEEHDLYASVMIAQAILESSSGNSGLASDPNYNLFGIKGDYNGETANFYTDEDDGSGTMYTISSNFRKYPSYKESLRDYAELLSGGTNYNSSFYHGTWKSNTSSYQDATSFLTGRYATDTSYGSKLDGLIEAYDLTQYDQAKDSKKAKRIALNTSFDKLLKEGNEEDMITHVVQKGESLKSISEMYDISTMTILDKNQLDRRMLFIGQKLNIPTKEDSGSQDETEGSVNKSLEIVEKVSSAFSDNDDSSNSKKSSKTEEYLVSATRKKTKQTYEVKKGDTLASISKKTGVSVWSLKEWNDLDKYFLTEGQELLLSPNYEVLS